MRKHLLTILPALAAILLLASCHSTPKHARFIPKDALYVLGVHTGEMRKEMAWSAITGSPLMDELRKSDVGEKGPQMLKDAENSGIDFSSTLYFYAKPDTRFANGARMGVVLPVSDAKKVTEYIKKYVPGAVINTVKGRSELVVEGKAYVGWNDEVLIAMSNIVRKQTINHPSTVDTIGGMAVTGEGYTSEEETPDAAATALEMEAAFNPVKDGGIDGNKRFRTLEGEGHDITMWVAYDAMLDALNTQAAGLSSLAMMGPMMKNSAMAAGFDFNKGSIDGQMRYFSSDSMRDVAKEFGKVNVDDGMLKRLPAGSLNFAAGYHLSPTALRLMLDKMNLTGVANMALAQQGLSIDEILGAFAGDMAVAVNNFRIESKMEEIDSATQQMYGIKPSAINSPAVDYVFALKVGDKAKMTKLFNFAMANAQGMLNQTAPNTYTLATGAAGTTLVMGDKYLAIGSTPAAAQAFLQESAGAMPEAVKKEVAGHPAGIWADIHSFMAAAAPMASGNATDSAAYAMVRNMFTTFTMNGGEFKGDASEFKMSLGFTNKEENTLVQILHLAQQLVANNNKKQVAVR